MIHNRFLLFHWTVPGLEVICAIDDELVLPIFFFSIFFISEYGRHQFRMFSLIWSNVFEIVFSAAPLCANFQATSVPFSVPFIFPLLTALFVDDIYCFLYCFLAFLFLSAMPSLHSLSSAIQPRYELRKLGGMLTRRSYFLKRVLTSTDFLTPPRRARRDLVFLHLKIEIRKLFKGGKRSSILKAWTVVTAACRARQDPVLWRHAKARLARLYD